MYLFTFFRRLLTGRDLRILLTFYLSFLLKRDKNLSETAAVSLPPRNVILHGRSGYDQLFSYRVQIRLI